MEAKIETGHVVVVIVRGRPKLARYVETTPGGKHVVRDGAGSDGEERLVERMIGLTEQP